MSQGQELGKIGSMRVNGVPHEPTQEAIADEANRVRQEQEASAKNGTVSETEAAANQRMKAEATQRESEGTLPYSKRPVTPLIPIPDWVKRLTRRKLD